jgi:hypothetical protein
VACKGVYLQTSSAAAVACAACGLIRSLAGLSSKAGLLGELDHEAVMPAAAWTRPRRSGVSFISA